MWPLYGHSTDLLIIEKHFLAIHELPSQPGQSKLAQSTVIGRSSPESQTRSPAEATIRR